MNQTEFFYFRPYSRNPRYYLDRTLVHLHLRESLGSQNDFERGEAVHRINDCLREYCFIYFHFLN
jgi:hypothetical protein